MLRLVTLDFRSGKVAQNLDGTMHLTVIFFKVFEIVNGMKTCSALEN